MALPFSKKYLFLIFTIQNWLSQITPIINIMSHFSAFHHSPFSDSQNDDFLKEQPDHYNINQDQRLSTNKPTEKYTSFAQENGIIQRNTNGKQYDENFKRRFVKSLIEKSKHNDVPFPRILQQQAERIHVFVNEVSTWLSIYKIIFKMEEQIKVNSFTPTEIGDKVQEHIVDFINQNLDEKRYKILKISNAVFRQFNVKKCTGIYWIKSLLKRYKSRIDPRVDIKHLINTSKRVHMNKYGDQEEESLEDDTKQDKQFSVKQKNPSALNFHSMEQDQSECESEEFQMKNDFNRKQKIVMEIDECFENHIKKIFLDKVAETNTSLRQLKVMYNDFGKFDIFSVGMRR